jgi:sulfotransferase family protein
VASLQITAIERLESAGEWLAGWGIDFPRIGEASGGHFLSVAGWVVGRHADVARIEILHDSDWLTGMPVLLVRPDVSEYLRLSDPTLRTGFQVALNTIGLPRTFELAVCAHVVDGPLVEFARLRGTLTPPRSSFQPALQPLSVTSLGRTGTTLVMQMLAEHPDVCVHRPFPFETRLGAYWMHALSVLGGPANHSESSHPDRFLGDRLFLGSNPYAQAELPEGSALRSWFSDQAPEELAAFCQRNIEAAYLRIARDQGEGPGLFFAEKNVPTYAPRLLSYLYPGAREIILVRDFRDMICSMMAFDGKRQRRDFQGDDRDGEAFVLRMVADYRRLLATWHERRHSALLLRYEDLIAEPYPSLRRVATYAGIDASPAVLERMVAASRTEGELTRAHRTTEDGQRSVGRHRLEMSEEMLRLCLEVGAEALTELGYATEGGPEASTRPPEGQPRGQA